MGKTSTQLASNPCPGPESFQIRLDFIWNSTWGTALIQTLFVQPLCQNTVAPPHLIILYQGARRLKALVLLMVLAQHVGTHTHTLHRQWVVTCWMVTGSCHSVLSIRDTNAKGRVGNKREQHPASPLCVKGDISRGQLEKDSRGWRQVAHNFVMRLNVSLFFRTKHFCTLDFCVHSTTDVSQRHPPLPNKVSCVL